MANSRCESVVIGSFESPLCVNMLRELLLIFTLICVTRCELSLSSSEDLYAILNRTTEYFKSLNNGKILIILHLNVKITYSYL